VRESFGDLKGSPQMVLSKVQPEDRRIFHLPSYLGPVLTRPEDEGLVEWVTFQEETWPMFFMIQTGVYILHHPLFLAGYIPSEQCR
jgi:hypothetical protein